MPPPLAAPPLFLGYLAGVPFTWTLRLWGRWLTMTLILLVVSFVWDTIQHRRESGAALRRDHTRIEPLRIHGGLNCVWLAGVVAAVALLQAPGREIAILGLAGISLWRTPRQIRGANQFTARPMVEVAVLFPALFPPQIPPPPARPPLRGRLGGPHPGPCFFAVGAPSPLPPPSPPTPPPPSPPP